VTGSVERRSRKGWALIALSLFFLVLFVGLGVWQLERRAGKLALIEAVDARVHGAPVAAPPPAAWGGITAARDGYRRVAVRGRFLHDRQTLVQALTEQGAGFWVLTPLRSDTGFTLLVNRGFVPAERAQEARRRQCPAEGPAQITGLLRVSEPGGGFLRSNQPAQDRWFSRDVAAIAQARGLGAVAPYFIDADASANGPGKPQGGMTVIRFPNNHLVYALTWFALAALSCVGLVVALRAQRR
jgi:surfeit locus 1 family protein